MSKTMQVLFFEALEAALPEGFSLNVDRDYANTGVLRVYRSGTFDPVVALTFQFNSGYASFQVPDRIGEVGVPKIGDRQAGTSFPYVTFDQIESRVLAAILNALKETSIAR